MLGLVSLEGDGLEPGYSEESLIAEESWRRLSILEPKVCSVEAGCLKGRAEAAGL